VFSAISYWRRMIRQVEETEIGTRQFVETQLAPVLIRRGNMGPVFSSFRAGRSAVGPDGATNVMVDEELVGFVARRMSKTRTIIRVLDRLKIAAGDVVISVEQAQNE